MRILPAKRGARDNANYRIEGILKRSWLEKMCGTIPAVLVLCIDWSEELSQPEQERNSWQKFTAARFSFFQSYHI